MKYMETKKYNKLNIAQTLQKIKFSSTVKSLFERHLYLNAASV